MEQMIEKLNALPLGQINANAFRDCHYDCLCYLFDEPERFHKEKIIDSGNQRVDILYSNHKCDTFFHDELAMLHGFKLPYVVFETKNYQVEGGNNELNQITGYLIDKIGEVAVLIANSFKNKSLIVEKSRIWLKNHRKVIFSLDNKDIINLLKLKMSHNEQAINSFWRYRYEEIAL